MAGPQAGQDIMTSDEDEAPSLRDQLTAFLERLDGLERRLEDLENQRPPNEATEEPTGQDPPT